jgi:hypothetical protein
MPKDDPDKQARLAEALRANLRRRKAQSRDQAASTQDVLPVDPKAEPSQP